MPLTLEVVGSKAAKMGVAARKVFQASGTIGRLRENDWVFPDEYISSRHAKIILSNGNFMIEDTSTNGVFVNSPQNRLARGQPYALKDGDTLFIDDYEVRVSLGAANVAEPYATSQSPLIPEDPFGAEPLGLSSTSDDMDPLKLLGLQDARPIAPGPSAAGLAGQSPMSQHYRPPTAPPNAQPTPAWPQSPQPPLAPPRGPAARPIPATPPQSANNLIPDDYDPFASEEPQGPPVDKVPPPRAPPPQQPVNPRTIAQAQPASDPIPRVPRPSARPPLESPPRAPPTPPIRPTAGAGSRAAPFTTRPAAGAPERASSESTGERRALGAADVDFAALLAGAGIDAAQVTPELAQQFGQILRVVVSGLMEVLRAREKIKDEFRMRMTTFKAADNNPLKFSANVEDALHNLLVKRNAAYLGPVDAFEDAFLDVRNHQMAMLAGVRVAYEAMLAEFQPEHLQEQFDRQLKGASFLSGPAKHKYWELYRDKFHDMVKDADSSFRTLFGDDFAKAYEEQMVRLKTLNRAERR